MKKLVCAFVTAGAIWTTAAMAEPEKPVTDKNPSAVDVAATPADTLNLRKKKIPPVLLSAEARPHAVPGGCPAISSNLAQLNKVLGPDVDKARSSEGIKAGTVAQSIVSGFIPFSGIIRQLSGAAKEQQELQDAINAGIARRGFLKGYGRAKGCRV